MKRLNYLKILREPVYTKLSLVKDFDENEYYVEKSLVVKIDFQEQLFENEVRIHSMLDHRYIIKFVQSLENYRFLMEYASNGNLQRIIDSNMDETLRIKLCFNFLKGLAHLHELGFVHNDIKPSNILITKDNRAKLADFAFAGKIGEVAFDEIPTSFVLGTDFFRPLQEINRYVSMVSNDIYAVGIVLYLLFSRAKVGNSVNLALIKNSFIKEIVQHCINGSFTSVQQVIDSLSKLG